LRARAGAVGGEKKKNREGWGTFYCDWTGGGLIWASVKRKKRGRGLRTRGKNTREEPNKQETERIIKRVGEEFWEEGTGKKVGKTRGETTWSLKRETQGG